MHHFTALKALLRYATFATQLASHCCRGNCRKRNCLDGVTCVAITKSRSVFVAISIARSRTRFYFTQQLLQCCDAFFTTARCNIPLETCLAIFLCAAKKTRYLKITSSLDSMAYRLRDGFEETLHSNIPNHATLIF